MDIYQFNKQTDVEKIDFRFYPAILVHDIHNVTKQNNTKHSSFKRQHDND